MKIKLIPSINVQNLESLKEKISILRDVTNHFHIDIAEKNFTGHYQTWLNPAYLNFIDENLLIDLHLMIYLKPQEILKWIKKQVRVLIIHPESTNNVDAILKLIKKFKKKVYICWSPNIDFGYINKYLNYVNGILVLGVNPGSSGQKFIETTYEKLKIINDLKKNKNFKIELMVDGGITQENLTKICQYSPDFIVMGSIIYNSQNPKETFLKIKNSLKL